MGVPEHLCHILHYIPAVPYELLPSSLQKVTQHSAILHIMLDLCYLSIVTIIIYTCTMLDIWIWYHIPAFWCFCVYVWIYTQLGTCNLCPLTLCTGTTPACWSVKLNISQWIQEEGALLECGCTTKAKYCYMQSKQSMWELGDSGVTV